MSSLNRKIVVNSVLKISLQTPFDTHISTFGLQDVMICLFSVLDLTKNFAAASLKTFMFTFLAKVDLVFGIIWSIKQTLVLSLGSFVVKFYSLFK